MKNEYSKKSILGMQQSDSSSVTSRSSEKKRYFPLVKKSSTEVAIAFDGRSIENRERSEDERKEDFYRMMSIKDDNDLFFQYTHKASKTTEEDNILIKNKEERIFVKGERTDLKTHYYVFEKACNCSRPCESKKCRHPVYFVHEIRAVYDGKLVSSRESDMIRRSERETTEVNLKEENSATELLLKQLKNSEFGKQVEKDFKKVDEGYEDDKNELTFKKARKTKKDDDSDTNSMEVEETGNAEDEVDGGHFSDDSDNDRELPNDTTEVDTIWIHENMEDSDENDEKNKDKDMDMNKDHLSESESESESEDMSEEENKQEVESGESEKELLGATLDDLFKRNGKRIRINQMGNLLSQAFKTKPSLEKWCKENNKQFQHAFETYCKRNDQTGFYEFRGL